VVTVTVMGGAGGVVMLRRSDLFVSVWDGTNKLEKIAACDSEAIVGLDKPRKLRHRGGWGESACHFQTGNSGFESLTSPPAFSGGRCCLQR
jgi:hypothetical protein